MITSIPSRVDSAAFGAITVPLRPTATLRRAPTPARFTVCESGRRGNDVFGGLFPADPGQPPPHTFASTATPGSRTGTGHRFRLGGRSLPRRC